MITRAARFGSKPVAGDFPSLALCLFLLCLNFIGDRLAITLLK